MDTETKHWLAQVNITFTDREGYKCIVRIPVYEFDDVPVIMITDSVIWVLTWCPVKESFVCGNAKTLRQHDVDLFYVANEMAHFAMYGGPKWHR